jgi:Domain of unknown function (DUF4168)
MIKQILTGLCLLIMLVTVSLPAYAQTSPAPVVQPTKPAADKPAADKPAADKPAADKPATDKPATDKPATDKPAADKPAAAQPTVSKVDLDKFAAAIKQMLTINQTSEVQIAQVIKTEGLTEQRFREIYGAERDPKAKPTPPITAPEKQSYDRAVTKIVKIQQADETQMEKVITAQGLDLKRFNEIFEVVQKNPNLQQEVKKRLQG